MPDITAHVIFTFDHSMTATIDLQPIRDAVVNWTDRTGADFIDKMDEIENRIAYFQYVTETCFYHNCWVKVDFETDVPLFAAQRLASIKTKLMQIVEELSACA